MLAFTAWWLIIQFIGLAALPLTRRVFTWLPGRGYAFSKPVGLLLVSYLLWLLASAGLLRNDLSGILLALLLAAGISAWAGLRAPAGGSLAERLAGWWRAERGQVLAVEALFLLSFAGWALLRAYSPYKIMPFNGEKFMEIAFLNGVLNSAQFPPLDPWMAGNSISYYYFGYVMMAVMTRLSGVAPAVGFDLYDALLFALTAAAAWGVASALVRASGGRRRAAAGAGLLGALFVTVLGNLEGLLEGLYAARALPGAFWDWIDIPGLVESGQPGSFYPGHGWWWWRASRVLRDLDLFYRPINIDPIDEFPFFSFLLGDNHPHKLALPFVLLAVGLALNLMLRCTAGPRAAPAEAETGPRGWRRAAAAAWQWRTAAGLYLFYALALGGLAFLNTWDFPIYLGLAAAARVLGERRAAGTTAGWRDLLLRGLGLAAALAAAAVLLYLPFYLNFSSQAGGVLPYIFPPTRLPQYLVMFGPFVVILAFFIYGAARAAAPPREWARAWVWLSGLLWGLFLAALMGGIAALAFTPLGENPVLRGWTGGLEPLAALGRILAVKAANPWLYLLLSALLAPAAAVILRGHTPDGETRGALAPPAVFALLLAFCGLALTLLVEFFYLQDSFGVRMNTIFKFYLQGWVLIACASAYACWWVMRCTGRVTRALFAALAGLLVAAALVYPSMAVISRTEGFRVQPTLDAATSFAGLHPDHQLAAQPDDWAAVQWLVENGRLPDGSPPVILEAGAGGYENAGRISAFTGFPTLLGWTNHEAQWRGSTKEIDRRAPVIASIYTTPSADEALELLRAWQVRYVILGDTERAYIRQACEQAGAACSPTEAERKFEEGFELVFRQGGTSIYRVP